MTLTIPAVRETVLRQAAAKVTPWGPTHPVTLMVKKIMDKLGMKELPSYEQMLGRSFRYNFPVVPIRTLGLFNNPERVAEEGVGKTKLDRSATAALAAECPAPNVCNPCVEVSASQLKLVITEILRDGYLMRKPMVASVIGEDCAAQITSGRQRSAALLALYGPNTMVPVEAYEQDFGPALQETLQDNSFHRKTQKSEIITNIGIRTGLRADTPAKQYALNVSNEANLVQWFISKMLGFERGVTQVSFDFKDMGFGESDKVLRTGRLQEILRESFKKARAKAGRNLNYTEFMRHMNATLEALDTMFFTVNRQLPEGYKVQDLWGSYQSVYYGECLGELLLEGIDPEQVGRDFAKTTLMMVRNIAKDKFVTSNSAKLREAYATLGAAA